MSESQTNLSSEEKASLDKKVEIKKHPSKKQTVFTFGLTAALIFGSFKLWNYINYSCYADLKVFKDIENKEYSRILI